MRPLRLTKLIVLKLLPMQKGWQNHCLPNIDELPMSFLRESSISVTALLKDNLLRSFELNLMEFVRLLGQSWENRSRLLSSSSKNAIIPDYFRYLNKKGTVMGM